MNWWKLMELLMLTTAVTVCGKESVSIRELETQTTGTAEEILVRKVEFDFDEDEDENVKIEFDTKVRYKNPTVTITDNTGVQYDTEIVERDWDDMELWVDGLSKDGIYTIEINGIKERNAKNFGTLKIEAQTERQIDEQKFYEDEITVTSSGMDRNIYIEDIEVEWTSNGKNIIDIDFITKVSYEKPTVTIKHGKDTQKATIRERDQDDIELIATDLKPGETYTITIDGIKPSKTKQTGTLTIQLQLREEITDTKTDPSSTTVARLKEAEYDREDEELELKFVQKIICSKDCSVIVTDRFGKEQELYILEIEKDEIKVDTSEIELGSSFEYKISGIKTTKETSYGTLSGKIVPDRD